MVTHLFNLVMNRRARGLSKRLYGWLAPGDRIADIGSGTGHNASWWRKQHRVCTDEFDVVDMHWVGPGPVLWDGVTLPCADAAYDSATLLFILQYTPDPKSLLREVGRVCSGRMLVMQSTYRGWWGHICLRVRETLWGRSAFALASFVHLIGPNRCPLAPRRYFTRTQLQELFHNAGFRIQSWESAEWYGMNISRDLYVLESASSTATFRSSSRPETKKVV